MHLFHSQLRNEVELSGQIKEFPSGSILLDFDTYIRSLPILLKGSMKVFKTDSKGKEILIYYIKPGESCIMSFLAGIHHHKSKVKALVEEDAEILLIPIDKAKEWIRLFPEWMDFIFHLYQKRFDELLEVVGLVAFQHLDVRLMNLLEQKSALYQNKEIKITHQQLADELGTMREAISRVLKNLVGEKKILISRNKIILL